MRKVLFAVKNLRLSDNDTRTPPYFIGKAFMPEYVYSMSCTIADAEMKTSRFGIQNLVQDIIERTDYEREELKVKKFLLSEVHNE